MLFCSPQHWKEYELIDSGNFEKLERFGQYILIRPEPQAVWDASLSMKEWENRAHAKFIYESNNTGVWKKYKKMPDEWEMKYSHLKLAFRCKLTAFKHVGIFPEQAVNWDYIAKAIGKSQKQLSVLNIFAYTGIASIASKYEHTMVTHVDSVKQVVNWAKENMSLSGKDDIRWIVEDARKFVQRELRRGKTYNGLIMDPPAFGRGAKGESWKLERDISQLLKEAGQLLAPDSFLILNTYSLGFSSIILENLIASCMSQHEQSQFEFGELCLIDSFNKKLPLGVFARKNSI